MTGPRSLDRRTVLRAGAGAGLAATVRGLAAVSGPAALVGGCGPRGQGRLEIAVGWGGGELDLFRQVIRGYRRKVQSTPVGDDIDAFLRTRHRSGTLPDVAVVPRPGLVRAYARRGWLEPLDDLADRFPDDWNRLVTVDGTLYGVWFRAAHKSLFWYLPSMFDRRRVPTSWRELVELVRDLARAGDGQPAPLAVGGADGWVLTDWFENLFAARSSREQYDRLSEGEPGWDDPVVRQAFADLAEIWRIPGAFPGGGEHALLTQFDHSVAQVAGTREALLVFEADFVASQAAGFLSDEPGSDRLAQFRFPSPTGRLPLVVGGDVAVVLRGSDAGLELVDWLTAARVDAFAPWREARGYLSPNRGVDVDQYPTALERDLVREIREPEEGLRFDLSDLLPGELNGARGMGTWQVLQDFFAHVTGGDIEVEAAIDEAVTTLDDMARRVAEEAEEAEEAEQALEAEEAEEHEVAEVRR